MVKRLDKELKQFAQRRLEEAYPHVILDARYEKVREYERYGARPCWCWWRSGSKAGGEGVLGMELANRENVSSWKEFLLGLRRQELRGMEFVVSDDYPGIRTAIGEVLTEAVW